MKQISQVGYNCCKNRGVAVNQLTGRHMELLLPLPDDRDI